MNIPDILAALIPLVPFDGNHADEITKGPILRDARRALAEYDAIAEAATEAASLADTAPAHAREFWRRLAGSLRKAATVPR